MNPSLTVPALTLFVCLVAALGAWLTQTSLKKVRQQFLAQMAAHSEHCGRQIAQMRTTLKEFETTMPVGEEAFRDGRLNRPVRARALELLRAGRTPEIVASTVGIARREAQLLARVAKAVTA